MVQEFLKVEKERDQKPFSFAVRIFANHFLTFLSNLINNQNLTDAHTCYKVFSSKIIKNINLQEDGFNFCPEVTTKISKLK
jgi:dolichol-phosphate mannosyltransferase